MKAMDEEDARDRPPPPKQMLVNPGEPSVDLGRESIVDVGVPEIAWVAPIRGGVIACGASQIEIGQEATLV